jgi:VWFA-related protein
LPVFLMRPLVACVFLLAVASVPVGRLRVTAQSTPQFRAAVDLVHLDVTVLDAQRRPVRGLTAADFTILEDGKPQAIAAFASVDVPDAEPPAVPWMRDVAPDTRRNDTLDERRLFVIVMDDGMAQLNTAATANAKGIARRFIDGMGPSDLAAVVFTLDQRNSQDYTSDRARLIQSVEKFKPGFRNMGEPGDPAAPDTDSQFYPNSIDAIRRVAEVLTELPQRRKTLVYIGQGVPVNPDTENGLSFEPPPGRVPPKKIECLGCLERLRNALRAAQRANVNVYTFDTCGLRPPPPPPPMPGTPEGIKPTCDPGLEQRYLQSVAENTGGRAALETNDFAPAIAQMFAENASYYLLGFQSTNPRQEGKYRRLQIRVHHPGAEVRARSGYVEPDAAANARPDRTSESTALSRAIAGLLPKSDVPLQVWTAVFPTSGRREGSVVMTLGVRQPLEERQRAINDVVELSVSAFSPDGRVRGQQQMKVRLALKPGSAVDIGYEVTSRILLAPGRYQLRIGAYLPRTHSSGSIYQDIDVPDFLRQGVNLSGIALAVVPNVRSATTDNPPFLPISPTTIRTFAPSDRVEALARVRQGGSNALEPLRVKVRVVDARGKDVWQGAQTLGVEAFAGRVAELRFPVPTAQLSSGPHLLELEVGPAGGKATIPSPVRQMRFSIR